MLARYILGGYASENDLIEQIMCSTFSPATFCGAYRNLGKLAHAILISPRSQNFDFSKDPEVSVANSTITPVLLTK